MTIIVIPDPKEDILCQYMQGESYLSIADKHGMSSARAEFLIVFLKLRMEVDLAWLNDPEILPNVK